MMEEHDGSKGEEAVSIKEAETPQGVSSAGEESQAEEDETWPHPNVPRTEGTTIDCGEAEEQMAGVAALGGDSVWLFEDGGCTYAGNVIPKAGRGYVRCECAIGGASGIGYPGIVVPSARVRTLLRASRGGSDVRISRSGSSGAGDGIILWSDESWHEIRGVLRRAEVMAERYRTKDENLEVWGSLNLQEMNDRLRLCKAILSRPREGQEWGRVEFYKQGFMTVKNEQHFAKIPYDGKLTTDLSLDIRVLVSALRMRAGQVFVTGQMNSEASAVVADVISQHGIIRIVEVGPEIQYRVDGTVAYDHGEDTMVCRGTMEDGLVVAQGARMLNATIPRRSVVDVDLSGKDDALALSCSHREKGMRAGSSYSLEESSGEGKISVNVLKLGALARTMNGKTNIEMYGCGETADYLVFESSGAYGVIFGEMRMRQDLQAKQLRLA